MISSTESVIRTRAMIVVPGFLSYCVVHDEGHMTALSNQFCGIADALDASPNRPTVSSSDDNVVLCCIDGDAAGDHTHRLSYPAASAHCTYFPFHLDFGPLTWMQCSKVRSELLKAQACIAELRREKSSHRVRRHRPRRRRGDETPSDDDDENFHPAARSEDDTALSPPPPPMLLVAIPLYKGVTSITNLVSMLGVIGVLSGALQTHQQIVEVFPMDGVMQWTIAFHDATPYDDVEAFFPLTAMDVIVAALHGFQRWPAEMLDVNRFIVAHDYFATVEGGDLSWIVPWRLIAFASPDDSEREGEGGEQHQLHCLDGELPSIAKPASFYADAFSDARGFYGCVHTVLQLNETPQYRPNAFLGCGIRHSMLCYPDGSCPSDDVVAEFFDIFDSIPKPGDVKQPQQQQQRQKTAMALHCMAGLGRTGTLAALVLMRDYGFSALHAIAWCRLCRPGCVIGPQQAFLCFTETKWKRLLLPIPTTKATPAPASASSRTLRVVRRSSRSASAVSSAPDEAPDEARDEAKPHVVTHVAPTTARKPAETVDVDRGSLVEVAMNRVVDTMRRDPSPPSERVTISNAKAIPNEFAVERSNVPMSQRYTHRSPQQSVTDNRVATVATVAQAIVAGVPIKATGNSMSQDVTSSPKVATPTRGRAKTSGAAPSSHVGQPPRFLVYTVGAPPHDAISPSSRSRRHSTEREPKVLNRPAAAPEHTAVSQVPSSVSQWLDEQRGSGLLRRYTVTL